MNSVRITGAVLIVVGFGIAVIAGLWIAFNISADNNSTTSVLLTGGGIFIPVALLTGFGAFLFVRSGKKQDIVSGIHLQRRLLELVKGKGQVSVDEVAIALETSSDAVIDMIRGLVELQVFSGYVNWDKGTLCSLSTNDLLTLNNCETCGNAIRINASATVVCTSCGTEYFLV